MELFSGAMAFHCLRTVCGIEDLPYKVRAGKPSSNYSVPDSSGFMCFKSWDFCREYYCGFSLLFAGEYG